MKLKIYKSTFIVSALALSACTTTPSSTEQRELIEREALKRNVSASSPEFQSAVISCEAKARKEVKEYFDRQQNQAGNKKLVASDRAFVEALTRGMAFRICLDDAGYKA